MESDARMGNNGEKLRIAMFGQKRWSREGGIEVVVEELSTRMVKLGHQVTCYNRGGHHVSGKEFDGDTLPVHSDAFVEYSDSNFTEKSLLSLEKLEIVTKEDPRNLDTSVSDYADSEHLVTEIARNYGLNPETARIIMNPNFAIIYDVNGDKLRVGDLLFNTRVDNEQQQMDIENQVVMQMRLALEQIASDKEIDVSSLDEKQKEMYAKITGLTDEMDIERGVGHAR